MPTISAVFDGHLASRYSCQDKGTERVVVTQLAEVLSLPDRQIAAAFDLHPVSVSRFGVGSRRRSRRLAPGEARAQGTVQDDAAIACSLPVSACRRGVAPGHCSASILRS